MVASSFSICGYAFLFVQSLHFHLQASPDKRTNALGVVVTDWLAHIILKAAVTLEVRLLYVWTIWYASYSANEGS